MMRIEISPCSKVVSPKQRHGWIFQPSTSSGNVQFISEIFFLFSEAVCRYEKTLPYRGSKLRKRNTVCNMAEWNDCNLWSPRIEDFKKCQHIDSIYTLNWISLGFYLLQAWMYDIYIWKQMFLKTEHCVFECNHSLMISFVLVCFSICNSTIQTKKNPVLPATFTR